MIGPMHDASRRPIREPATGSGTRLTGHSRDPLSRRMRTLKRVVALGGGRDDSAVVSLVPIGVVVVGGAVLAGCSRLRGGDRCSRKFLSRAAAAGRTRRVAQPLARPWMTRRTSSYFAEAGPTRAHVTPTASILSPNTVSLPNPPLPNRDPRSLPPDTVPAPLSPRQLCHYHHHHHRQSRYRVLRRPPTNLAPGRYHRRFQRKSTTTVDHPLDEDSASIASPRRVPVVRFPAFLGQDSGYCCSGYVFRRIQNHQTYTYKFLWDSCHLFEKICFKFVWMSRMKIM